MANILVVDDDEIVAGLAAQMLIDAGHGCGWVSDAETAMRMIQWRKPDLLLLDERLPYQSGTTFLCGLRMSEQFYDLPVIMLTGIVGEREEQIALFNGAQDYIRKPFDEFTLLHRVERLLERRGLKASASSARAAAPPVHPSAAPLRRI